MGALLWSACVKTDTKRCGDFVCSDISVCAPDGERCVSQAQLDACRGMGDNSTCSVPAGTDVGVCDRELLGAFVIDDKHAYLVGSLGTILY